MIRASVRFRCSSPETSWHFFGFLAASELASAGWRGARGQCQISDPEVPRSQCLRFLVPETMLSMVFGTREP